MKDYALRDGANQTLRAGAAYGWQITSLAV